MHFPVIGIKVMLFSARPAKIQFFSLSVYNLPHKHRSAVLSAYLTYHAAFLVFTQGFLLSVYFARIIQTMIDKIKDTAIGNL